jgi:PRTRC genetic system protein A
MLDLASNLIPLYLYQGHRLPRPEHLYDYVVAEQGLIKRLENSYASADLLLEPFSQQLPGLRLQPYPLQPLRVKLPRIPGQLLRAVLADAQANLQQEMMYHLRFEPGQGWAVTRPAQDRSWARVGYQMDPTGVALDLHSHHRMPPFFSGTDDADEQGGRFYGVLGHLDRPQPELALRLGMYGQWLYNVPALALFEELGPLVEVYVDETDLPSWTNNRSGWLDRVLPWR